MKLKTIATISVLVLATQVAQAKGSSEEKIGFGSGLVAGALAGGPVGAILGATIGAWSGDKAHSDKTKSRQIAQLEQQIDQARKEVSLAQKRANDPKLLRIAHTAFAKKLSSDIAIDLLFRTDSAELQPQANRKIAPIASLLRAFPEVSVNLLGHADVRGADAHNLTLSRQRARVVKKALLGYGISPTRIHVQAFGERFANATATDIDGTALDRRVAIRFTTTTQDDGLASSF